MNGIQIEIVAGEPSGDQLAAELVAALRRAAAPRPVHFFGAGGPRMAAAGVALEFDLTQHALIGIPTLSQYLKFRRFRDQLVTLSQTRAPDAFIGVDYFGFNGRVATQIREQSTRGARPRIIQFVSPQVWASRPGRARRMTATHDLLLSILPFEKDWYQQNAPGLAVEFVGHPMVDRHGGRPEPAALSSRPKILLLPGSRPAEIQRHGPVLMEAAQRIRATLDAEFLWVSPNARLSALAQPILAGHPEIQRQEGGLESALRTAHLALASTGTVTLECAWFRVPFVALYKTSWLTYEIGRRIITVPHLAMPNLLAGREIAREFVQHAATPGNLAEAALQLLRSPERHAQARRDLDAVVDRLGSPGAVDRAAGHILKRLG